MCIESKSIDHMITLKENGSKYLKNVVCFDEIPQDKREKAEQLGLKMYHFDDVI